MFRSKRDPDADAVTAGDAVAAARTRARRRLIGAAVLLGIGVVAFPLVFETQPRPIPVDVAIEIPKKDSLPPLAAPPVPPATSVPRASTTSPAPPAAAPAASAPRATAAAAIASSASASASTRPRAAETIITETQADQGREVAIATPAPRPASAVASASSPRAGDDDGRRALALLEGRSPAASEAARYVVQVGAFADAESARETRQRVEKLGLKTYTQVAQTAAGNRIRVRVGPFASRDAAETALGKAKAAGLTAVVLTL